MNIRDLKYLVTVAELRHFGKAAAACFVSQPTLSAQIKKLEERLGVKIFERTNKQVIITANGAEIISHARLILNNVEKLKEEAKHLSDPFAGKITIGIIPSLGPYLLPHIIQPIKAKLPLLELYLREDKTHDLLNALRLGELDSVVLALPIPSHDLTIEPLFTEDFYLATPKNHRLAKKSNREIRFDDIADECLLLLEEGHCLRDQALQVCQAAGAQELPGFRATSLETLRHMVAAGSGLTLLPKLAIHPSTTDQLSILPFSKPSPSREIAMAWRHNSSRKRCNQELAEIIRQEIEKPTMKSNTPCHKEK